MTYDGKDLFGPVPHDPGGKVRLALRPGIRAQAVFSRCGRYRRLLSRDWGEGPFALWIGMNPSTADASADDPTVAREVAYTRDRLGLARYVKTNVMDYRATHPRDLLAPGVAPSSPENLPEIVALAADAAIVVLAFGAVHPRLRHHPVAVESALAGAGVVTHCLGTTKDGSPRHPLYLSKDAPLAVFDAPAWISNERSKVS